jgi:hypothetical protein
MSDIPNVPEEIIQEAVDTTYELGRQAGRGLVRVGFLTGFSGLVIGSAVSYFMTRRYLETKYNQIAEDEIAEMREHYRSKTVALENTVGKDDLEEIVREKGYAFPPSTEPPMAVSAPTAVVEAAAEFLEEDPSEEVLVEPPQNRNVFEEARVVDNWDYNKEKARRSPVKPYIIHYDERHARDYDEATLTYYEVDDVLCNEIDEVIAGLDRDRLVGEDNLEKFGHGSNDAHIVYIRHDKLELQYEVVRSPNSYAEEVHGFEHADTKRRRKKRYSNDD